MTPWMLVLVLWGLDPQPPQLLIPNTSSETRIGFSVTLGDQPADRAWSDFLEHWHAFFDVNHDGQWSENEAAAVPAIPNATGASARIEMKVADSSGDREITHDELLTYYQRRGVSSVNTGRVLNDTGAIQLNDDLWERLDQDHDGTLSNAELSRAAALLNRCDRNEDERLTPQELALPSKPVRETDESIVRWSNRDADHATGFTIPLALNGFGTRSLDDSLKAMTTDKIERLGDGRLRVRQSSVTLIVHQFEGSVQRIGAARQYLLGELETIRGPQATLRFSQIRAEPALDWLVPLLAAADVDHDEQLSETEQQAVVNLLGEGAAAQVSLTVSQRGLNLFDRLDTNADYQLDLRELNAAKELLDRGSSEPFTRAMVPLSLVVDVKRGPLNGRFGRLRIALRSNEAATLRNPPEGLPRWFAAMDRNRDQALSPSEYIGSTRRFGELDRNSDGVITINELRMISSESPNR